MSLESDIKAYKDRLENIKADSERAAEIMEGLREKIKAGESTGNPLKDYCIAQKATLEDEYLAGLDKSLRKNIHRIVFLVESETSVTGCPGIIAPAVIPPENLSTNRTYRVGVLNEEPEWQAKSGKLILPMQAGFHLKRYGHSWRDVYHDMRIDYHQLLLGNKGIRDIFSERSHAAHEFALYAGKEAEDKLMQAIFRVDPIYEKLSYDPPGSTWFRRAQKKKDPLRL